MCVYLSICVLGYGCGGCVDAHLGNLMAEEAKGGHMFCMIGRSQLIEAHLQSVCVLFCETLRNELVLLLNTF